MNAQKLERISELARKSRVTPLSPAELEEQAALRLEYRRAVVENLRSQLDNITVVEAEERLDQS